MFSLLPVAQGGAPAGLLGSPFLLIAVLFAVMYFTMIRPQARQAKQHREMVAALKKGDRVITAGGLHGTVGRIDETTIQLRMDGEVKLTVEKSKVIHVMAEPA